MRSGTAAIRLEDCNDPVFFFFLAGQCLGVNSCCSFSNRCGLGEGDCDSDGECVEGLVCGRCQHEFEVPVFGRWVMEEENFSRTDTCCRLPEEFEREFEF